ncbi:MAG: efflux RND transporter permease subunit [Defluviitaleaceae bacterium]|nr:efflux RND transporter permease subunit [Defluviitaleaceae bacterium]MCL2204302.1 efflux RND transporter permease subunit [Defluviitaleaceae bacterium]
MSVRKPFTVLVGVILVIVLGIVSVTSTSTDLLPAMDLPFSAVFTTYIGATPEQVERDVSIPIESRMSTLSGIEMVQSISSEHVSIIILQFTETTNMDSASLEIREALDMMTLPDGASRPMMIRMNPEMLPIMTANVHREGVTIDALSEFARYTIAPAIEGVPGVAMVSLSGLVQNQLHVIIEQARIDTVNAELGVAMGAMIEAMTAAAMAEAEAVIDAAYAEMLAQAQAVALEMGQAALDGFTAEIMGIIRRGEDETRYMMHAGGLDVAITERVQNEVRAAARAEFNAGVAAQQAEAGVAMALAYEEMLAQAQEMAHIMGQAALDAFVAEHIGVLGQTEAEVRFAMEAGGAYAMILDTVRDEVFAAARAEFAIAVETQQVEGEAAIAMAYAAMWEQTQTLARAMGESALHDTAAGFADALGRGEDEVRLMLRDGGLDTAIMEMVREEVLTAARTEFHAAVAEQQAEAMAEMAAAPPQEMPPAGLPAAMLTVETIHTMLFAQDFAMPAGAITDDDFDYMVRVGDRFEEIDEVKNMLLFDPSLMGLAGVEPVRLSDIADVFITDDAHLTFTRVNGNPSVMLSIQRQSEFTTADIANAVRNRFDALSADYEGLGFVILMDQGEMIGVVVGGVLNSLLWGGLLAIVILLLFLRDIRPTLIVAVSIPVSLLLAFTLMYFTGVSLNMISMGGLALAVGMLVDNSIVVIENIYRMRLTTDRSAARAAVSGTMQVAGAIVVASLTTISVFFPIVFTGGITRQLFTDLALTIGYSLMASLIIALTVVPAASSVMLKNMKKDHEGRFFTKFVDGYEVALRFALRFKIPVLVLAVAAFGVTFWGIARQGMELFPAMDMGQISITAEMPEDATFEEATVVAEAFSAYVLAIGDVETVGVSVGGGGMMGMMAGALGFGGMGAIGGQSTEITMYVLTGEERVLSQEELLERIRTYGEGLGLEIEVDGGDMGMGMMMGDAISLRVEGRELDDIRDTAIAVAYLIRSVPGTTNVTDLVERGAQELRVTVDKDAAMAQGLTVAQVFMAVNAAITAPERSMNMTLSGRTYEIVVSDGDFTVPDREALRYLQIETQGGYVTLSDIAEIREDIGFTSINRINRNRFVTVQGELEEGYNVTLVNAEIERLLEDFVPIGASQIIMGGEAEAIADAMGDLMLMLLLALIFIYLIMVAQFQSLLSPFIIMLTIPLAFTGGFVALLIAGMPLSIVAMIGLILLAGVSTNNGIVYISRVNQMRWEGMPKKEAIIDAGRKRIRPILMMAISTIFAMGVLAMGFGEGTEMMQPMAVAIIGGLVYATAMTLFVAPILYDLLHRNKDVTKEDLDNDD